MIRMRIAADNSLLAELQFLLAKAGQGALPATAAAMKEGAYIIKEEWRRFAMGGDLDGVKRLNRPSAGYARSIRTKQTSAFSHEIYSEAKIAERIENGTHEHDMKKTHPFGPKSRVSKEGYGYLIVPIRWGTPDAVGFKNIMPINVYNIVEKFKKMMTLVDASESLYKTQNAQTPSKMVGRAQYNKGYDRLSGMDIAGTIEQKTRMSGMVRSTESTGKDRSAGYFTFRVISANPNSASFKRNAWVRPATPARNVTGALANNSQQFIEGMVDSAIKEDFRP